jgi:hypothetical protein
MPDVRKAVSKIFAPTGPVVPVAPISGGITPVYALCQILDDQTRVWMLGTVHISQLEDIPGFHGQIELTFNDLSSEVLQGS